MTSRLSAIDPTHTEVSVRRPMLKTEAAATAGALMTVGVAAVAWLVAIQQLTDMDMTHSAAQSFGSFMSQWLLMIAAMMLPGAAPAVFESGKRRNSVSVVALVVGAYVAIWTAVGAALYAVRIVYWPHTSFVAGTTAIAAGIYELTPVKNRFRERCRHVRSSGLQFAVHCVGSSSGLMLMQLMMGMMNIAWMLAIGALMLAQKALPLKPSRDVPLALALVGFGILLVLAPWMVPEVLSPM